MKKIKNFIQKVRDGVNKVGTAINTKTAIAMATIAAAVSVPAVGFSPIADLTYDELLDKILGIVFMVFRGIGVVLLIWAIADFVMAHSDQNPAKKKEAITLLISAIVLFAIEGVLKAFGILT